MIKPIYIDHYITLYHAKAEDILPHLQDSSIHMVFTDPPYGINVGNGDMIAHVDAIFRGGKGTEKDSRTIANDNPEQTHALVQYAFREFKRLLVPGACCCCCCSGGGGSNPHFAQWSLWLDEAFDGGFKMAVVWDKGPIGLGHHYRRSYEFVLVAQKGGAACKWYAGDKDIENIIRPGDYGIRKIIPASHQHPTEKPVELAEHFIRLHTQPGEIVLDPFAGGGSTLVAARRLQRRAIGIELEEKYCKMIIQKLSQLEIF